MPYEVINVAFQSKFIYHTIYISIHFQFKNKAFIVSLVNHEDLYFVSVAFLIKKTFA